MSDNNSTHVPTSLPPAGWYPDPQNPATQRYWDGARWLAHDVAPAASADVALDSVPAATRATKKLSWWQWALIALGALVLIGIISGALGGSRSAEERASGDERVAAADRTAEPIEEEVDTTVAVPEVVGKAVSEARGLIEAAGFTLTVNTGAGEDWLILTQGPVGGQKAEPGTPVSVIAEAPKPVYTLEQENALRAAQSYLDFTGFSRQGLIDQLSSEYGSGYPVDVATWAADTVGADWNAEAVESAQSYLEFTSFSRQGLYDQLTSAYGGQFTPDQANHALAAVGY